jgi:hypothetical protein
MTRGAKMGASLLHNIGLAFGAQLIGMFEGKGIFIEGIFLLRIFLIKFRYWSSMVNV